MGLDLLVFDKLCRVQEPPMGNSEHTESLRAAHISFEAGVVPHVRGCRHKSKGSREPKPGNCQTGPANSATGSVLEVTRRLRESLHLLFTVAGKKQKSYVAAVRAVPLPHETGAFAFAPLQAESETAS